MRAGPIAAALLWASAGSALAAQGPEQLEQLEPDGGQWQAEYYGIVSEGRPDTHSIQLLYGVSGRLALGIEAEAEWRDGGLHFDAVAPTLLYRFSDAEEGLGAGIELQAELDGEARFAGAEARLILERRTPGWWLQGNAVLRHQREDGEGATGLAYGWALARKADGGIWLGLEGSGQAARLGGARAAWGEAGHFAGPAVTFEAGEDGREIEIGFAYLRRIAGDGPRQSGRLFVQFSF